MSPAKVLFLCTGNSARSQMAEALLRERGEGRFEAYSAGLRPTEVHPMAIQAMKEIGVDISDQRAKSATEYLGGVGLGYLITVCDRAAADCPVFPGRGERLHWSIDDPAAAKGSHKERLQAFRAARDDLARRIDAFIAEHA